MKSEHLQHPAMHANLHVKASQGFLPVRAGQHQLALVLELGLFGFVNHNLHTRVSTLLGEWECRFRSLCILPCVRSCGESLFTYS